MTTYILSNISPWQTSGRSQVMNIIDLMGPKIFIGGEFLLIDILYFSITKSLILCIYI